MRGSLLIALPIFAATSAGISGVAHAQSESALLAQIEMNTMNTDNDVKATNNSVQKVDGDTVSGDESIVQAIQALTQQETANVSASQQANANMQQVIDRQNVATQISAQRLAAMRQATSGYSSCNTIYGGQAMQAFTPALLAYKENLFQMDNAFLNNQKVINGVKQPSATSIPVTIQMSVTQHCKNFASQADIDQGLCPSGTPVSTDPAADTDMGHLMDQISMSPEDLTAAQAFLRLAVHPLPFQPVPQNVIGTQQAAVDELQREAAAARLSIAYKLISIGLINRAPIQNDEQLQDWAEGTAKDSGYQASSNGMYFPNGVSLDAAEKLRADSWVEDTNFTSQLSGASQSTLLKDIFNVEAFRAQVDVENKMLQEQIAAGIGALLANSVKANPTVN